MTHKRELRPIFILRIEGKSGGAGIRDLRRLLKTLLRRYQFRCLDAREIGIKQEK
jgi:hypothetical protein